MFSRFLSAALVTSLLSAAPVTLRVCADPNNLPFSNQKLEGFENRIAEILGRDLNAKVEYFWWAQRRGFVRNTLRAGQCDVIMGLPAGFEMVLTTKPYYRSTYVFLTRKGRGIHPRSFDDPVLRKLRIGVQLVGDDYANTPPAHALSRRGIIRNISGYQVAGDYSLDSPASPIVRAVAEGDVEVAVVWGPLAGYYAQHSRVPLELTPVSPEIDEPSLPFVFDIAIGVRRGDVELKKKLDRALLRRRVEIIDVLRTYGVPMVGEMK
jgi:quinoprotein dehydrogenase-associated probable ABC transporter substrate-binding protein